MTRSTNHLEQDILAVIKHAITSAAWVEEETITPSASLKDDLNLDSLDVIETVMNIEDEMHISIDDEKAAEVVTVQDLINLVDKIVGH